MSIILLNKNSPKVASPTNPVKPTSQTLTPFNWSQIPEVGNPYKRNRQVTLFIPTSTSTKFEVGPR